MPYIKKEDREKFECALTELSKVEMDNKGELEYVIFSIMMQYMTHKEMRYSTLHDCVYAVQHCSDEFRRRFLDKREDEARGKNGDV